MPLGPARTSPVNADRLGRCSIGMDAVRRWQRSSAATAVLRRSSYLASEGRCVGRDGRVATEFDYGTIWLGGHAVTCIEGSLIEVRDLANRSLEQQRPAVSQTRRVSITAGTETHIATLQASTISRRTARARYPEPPPVTIAILPARPYRIVPPLGFVIDSN